jgi:hypothetical protein
MEFPEILKGAHVPLTSSMTSDDAIKLANGFYQTDVDPDQFKKSQAFWNPDSELQIDLIDPYTGEVFTSFVNKASKVNTAAVAAPELMLANPLLLSTAESVALMGPVIVLGSAVEIEFLDAVGSGATYPTTGTDNNAAFDLKNLLNAYQFLGGWVSGTLGDYAVGGFRLVYKGPSDSLPEGFPMDPSPMVAVIEILHGQQKGYICLRT